MVLEATEATDRESNAAPSTVEDGLRLKGLTKRYGSRTALDDLSFDVEPGQMFGFVGANGAGKTTAMRIMLGVLQPDSGEVIWRRGKPADGAARRTFGYMPEERGLYPKMRVGEQLRYMARLHGFSRSRASSSTEAWLKRLGVHERESDEVEALSLGNQQRVQLAAALVHDPELLVLDEPFSGLDPLGLDAISEVLAERTAEGVPVILSSHQLYLVENLCDAVAIIKGGCLIATGPVEELRSSEDRVLRIHIKGARDATASWAREFEGVEVLEVLEESGSDDGNLLDVRLSLGDGFDEQVLLDAARKEGRVEYFGFDKRTLSDIFREVMGS